MCGIVGFTGPKDKNKLKEMTHSIFHRGPDDDGYIETDNFSIGFRRLAIIDLTSDIYPVTNEDGSIKVVLNGEIYNFKEIKSELENLGHKFSNHTDTEVILAAYAQWGTLSFSKLNGMFAFALWDEINEDLFSDE